MGADIADSACATQKAACCTCDSEFITESICTSEAASCECYCGDPTTIYQSNCSDALALCTSSLLEEY